MGSVYRARDLETGQIVALKVLHLERPFDLVRFGREATLLAKVHHPNVVDYVAHGESEGVHYLVQEWVEGVTLAEKLEAVGITAPEAVQVAIGLRGRARGDPRARHHPSRHQAGEHPLWRGIASTA